MKGSAKSYNQELMSDFLPQEYEGSGMITKLNKK